MTDKQPLAAPTSTSRGTTSRLSADPEPALAIDNSKPFRFLAMFDPMSDAWKPALAPIFSAFVPSDPVAVILRVESPSAARVNLAVERLTAFVAQLGKKIEDIV